MEGVSEPSTTPVRPPHVTIASGIVTVCRNPAKLETTSTVVKPAVLP